MEKWKMNDLPSTLPQEFTKDLPYEIDQLRGTYERLIVGSSKDGVIQNALIESFATHARILVEMFLGKRNSMDPTRFTEPQYSPDRVSLQVLYSEICGQISHLQEGARAKNDSDKFNATAPRTIGLLETEIKHFTECLRPGCVFKCETQPVKVAEDALPSVSATNAIFSVTAPATADPAAELPRRDG
jgi:hypothetical protein